MSSIKIELGFGTRFAGNGRWLSDPELDTGISLIRARAVELFQGCTLTRTQGDWLDPETSKVVSEPGATLSVLADMPPVLLTERVNALVACIKLCLSQKAVAVTHYAVNSEIV